MSPCSPGIYGDAHAIKMPLSNTWPSLLSGLWAVTNGNKRLVTRRQSCGYEVSEILSGYTFPGGHLFGGLSPITVHCCQMKYFQKLFKPGFVLLSSRHWCCFAAGSSVCLKCHSGLSSSLFLRGLRRLSDLSV
jgi:hypothetical protein